MRRIDSWKQDFVDAVYGLWPPEYEQHKICLQCFKKYLLGFSKHPGFAVVSNF